jgi:hypothetical protein
MGDSYNANIDKKKPPVQAGGFVYFWQNNHNESLLGVAVLTSYNALNIPWPGLSILPVQTPGTSHQLIDAEGGWKNISYLIKIPM